MSSFVFFNPNPAGIKVGDCVIRAISAVTGDDWEDIYNDLAAQGFMMCDLMSSNAVWGTYLSKRGYVRYPIPNTCPGCYTVKDFCEDYPEGTYLLALDGHVVAVRDGRYFDTWDSGDKTVIYFWRKDE